jgi:quinol monooxygenase YgiN
VIVVRFKLRCSPGNAEEVRGLLAAVQSASQAVPGVITFDIGRDLLDADAFIATEVFDDRAALDRQEALPEVAAAMAAFDGALVVPLRRRSITSSRPSPTSKRATGSERPCPDSAVGGTGRAKESPSRTTTIPRPESHSRRELSVTSWPRPHGAAVVPYERSLAGSRPRRVTARDIRGRLRSPACPWRRLPRWRAAGRWG